MSKSHLKPALLKRTLPWALIIVVGILVYANSLWSPFIYDDDDQILKNTSIHTLWPPTWLTQAQNPTLGIHGRVIVGLTLALNYHFGGTQVTGYHIVNVAIHIFAALVLFCITRRILQSKYVSSQYAQASDSLALTIALIWLVHPLQTECVNYILQRSESLMGLFYLLTVYCAIRNISTPNAYRWPLAAILFCALGMASKEVMVSAPLMVMLCDRTFYFESFKQAFQKRRKLYLGLIGTWTILAFTIWHRPHGNTIGFETFITPWDYAKNQCIILVKYLTLSFWPHPLQLDYGIPTPNLPLMHILPYASVVILLLVGTLYAYKHHPPLGFLGAWFFLILGPTSSFIPIVTEVGAERRMYLPLVALVALVVIGIYHAIQYAQHRPSSPLSSAMSRKGISYGLVICVVSLFSVLSFLRNQDYQDSVSIWQTVVNIAPNRPRALNNLGYQLNAHKRPAEAIPYLQKALTIKPNYVFAHYNLGQAFLDTGEPEKARSHFQKAIDADTNTVQRTDKLPKIHNSLGVAFLQKEDPSQAILHFQETIALDSSHVLAQNNLGVAFLQSGQYQKAREQFENTLNINPNYTGAQVNLLLALQLLEAQK